MDFGSCGVCGVVTRMQKGRRYLFLWFCCSLHFQSLLSLACSSLVASVRTTMTTVGSSPHDHAEQESNSHGRHRSFDFSFRHRDICLARFLGARHRGTAVFQRHSFTKGGCSGRGRSMPLFLHWIHRCLRLGSDGRFGTVTARLRPSLTDGDQAAFRNLNNESVPVVADSEY